jgi:predicted TIM-barrel fold metal-dependent hydrolase
MAADRKIMVQIALSMEDPRTQFPLMPVPPADPTPLADLLPRLPQLNLVLLNAGYWGGARTPGVGAITKAGNAYFDIAMNEGVGGLERLIAETSPSRVVFGSHYPFFYFESALLKVRSAGLPRDQESAVYEGNARSLLNQVS